MGTSKTQPNDWMTKDGSGNITTFADERGWCIQHANGFVEVIHCMKDVVETPAVAPTVLNVENPAAGDYSVGAGDVIQFVVFWSEPVTITGTPQIAFNENGVGQTADYDPAQSSSNKSVFEFTVTTAGAIDTVVEAVQANGGTIVGADDGVTAAIMAFDAGYVQPTGVTVVA